MRPEDRKPGGLFAKMRCNQCSRLATHRNMASADACVCGCRAWFLSRVTWYERMRFFLGIDKDGDTSKMTFSKKPIGGHADMIHGHWTPTEEKNGIQTAR
jgi:hypothetical protein